MNIKDQLLCFWLLVVMALSFLLSHFLSFTLFTISRAVAFGLAPLLFSKLAAGMGVQFFP